MTELISGSRIDITNAVDSIPPYVSELIISTLDDVVDNGDHSCTVIVTPRSGRENALTASTPVSEGQMVIVASESVSPLACSGFLFIIIFFYLQSSLLQWWPSQQLAQPQQGRCSH